MRFEDLENSQSVMAGWVPGVCKSCGYAVCRRLWGTCPNPAEGEPQED